MLARARLGIVMLSHPKIVSFATGCQQHLVEVGYRGFLS
jgi:hypothetical protein